MEAGGHSWGDAVKKNYLDNTLNREMWDRIVTITKEDGFVNYCNQLLQIADWLEENC